MKALIFMEAVVIAAILIAFWLSLGHDHEGEWMDIATGEVFLIVPTDKNVQTGAAPIWTVTGASQSFALTRATGIASYANFVIPIADETPRVGAYDRIRGTITWQAVESPLSSTIWKRLADGRGAAPLSWIRARNLVRSWTLDGRWAGRTSKNVPVMLQITDTSPVQAELQSGGVDAALRGTITGRTVNFTNLIGEQFRFDWDGRARAIFMYHNEQMVLYKLD